MISTIENYPTINVPHLYKYGLSIQNSTQSPLTKLSILAGTCRDATDVIDIRVGDFNPNVTGNITSAPLRIDSSINGSGGLDQGTILPNTIYAIYVIADSRNYLPVAGIATIGINIYLAAGSILMPSGYDSFRLIGFWPTDSSGNWFTGYNYGIGNNITFTYDAPQITSVSAGTSNIYAYVQLFDLVPLIDGMPVSLYTIFNPGLAGDMLTLTSGRSSAPTGQAVITGQVNGINSTNISSVLAQNVSITGPPQPTIQYKVSGTDTVAIYVAGFSYSLQTLPYAL